MKKKFFEELLNTLLEIKDKKMLKDFLIGILTPAELEEIPVRLQIVKLLLKGYSQREVAKKLKVGVATVSRGARELKLGRFKFLREKYEKN